ncbi:MAG: hypothetical protein Q9225_002593 [Loekoesia sp. 1 TL-2023]
MAGHDFRPSGNNTVLLFGPQALSFDENTFRRLASSLSSTSNQQWVLDTIKELPDHWDAFNKELPHLSAVPGGRLLRDLIDWFSRGAMPTQKPGHLPNILLSPLVVIAQLAQYAEYLVLCHPESQDEDLFAAPMPDVETLGFCTGILSAVVVSCSTNKMQFAEYGATAVRLAVLIGGLVDAQDARDEHGESKSLATVWKSHQSQLEMARILQRFPEAYVSVNYDEHRATVTTSQKSIPNLAQQLKVAGIIASDIGLWGRFHCQCYRDIFEQVLHFCNSQPAFRFPAASSLVLPTRSNTGGTVVTQGHLHEVALRAILLETSNWYETFATVHHSRLLDNDSRVVSFGPERCVPPSFTRCLGSRSAHLEDLHETMLHGLEPSVIKYRSDRKHDVAVIGMACNVAGADDLEEFWKILTAGKSQHKEVPSDRFTFETTFRNDEHQAKWYGNFINDHKAFDHKFFKKTPREAASMDPQQRLLLQVAYQAVEQSGYFQLSNTKRDSNIGCYIGVCATDYENNIACHAPNAFSATGNLRSFIAGKISHYFGWTGPGLTIDTACSASAVAIHQACTAIASGECYAALAGGTNMMSQPLWFQNLAGASFLSPTGQCKPFDAAADGYCRGEAIASVFLKNMSLALEDGDQILGVIPATAVYQNQNCTPIFVPNAPSLSDLFRKVVDKSGLDSKQISVVEAHGTGTPVGDPAEYESIRQVFGGHPKPLQFGSVKGLVGHTEGTSGVVSLIKVLLMIQEGYIPPQASFNSMNPAIDASPSDRMEVTTRLTPWVEDYRVALINNYGASGSNASLVVTEAPKPAPRYSKGHSSESLPEDLNYPFWFPGLDDRSLRAYTARFRRFLRSKTVSANHFSMANLAFNVSRQSNRGLDRALLLSCRSIDELDRKLAAFENGESTVSSIAAPQASRSVILCFGGQISTYVGLSYQVFNNVKVLRRHLDQCDAVCQALGVTSIYPGIFQTAPVDNPVELQTMLFAVQYASAKSWIECGIQPSAVIGHSFGELTALCISGILSLRDALKMIVGRSTVIQDSWGSDRGAMLAVEGGLDEVKRLLAESSTLCDGSPANIACFNGPRSFTLAGPVQSVDAVAQTMASNAAYLSMLSKRLNVTHAYHSTLVEPLVKELEHVGEGLTFNEPKIQLERATEFKSFDKLAPKLIADHMREPVYFNHAVQRLHEQYPSSVWLEASSNATVTTMASRALGSPKDCHFQPVNISTGKPLEQLMDITLSLWKAGLRVTYWAHSPSQTYDYAPLLLPPYQFDKQQHWLDLKTPPKTVAAEQGNQAAILTEELPTTLYTFIGFQDEKQSHPRFRINTMIKKYEDIVLGHTIAQTAPICPATVQVDIAIEALLNLHPQLAVSDLLPQIRNVVNEAPICIDPSRSVWIDYEAPETEGSGWQWRIFSNGPQSPAATTHATGEIVFRSIDDAQYQAEFGRYERLVEHARCLRVLECNDADDIIQGRSIYKYFSEVVDYGERYHGLQRLVGKDNESAGRAVKKHSGESWLDPFLGDCFSQVGGIWVNCMAEKNPGDMYIANGFELWARSPKLVKAAKDCQPQVWHIFAHHDRAASGNAFLTDIFIFDATTGLLHEIILGINYTKVPKSSMSKLLSRLTANGAANSKIPHDTTAIPMDSQEVQAIDSAGLLPKPSQEPNASNMVNGKGASSSQHEISTKLKAVLADIAGLEPAEIKDDVELGDIGIDSLLGMEMAREIEGVFQCSLPQNELMDVFSFKSLMRCLQSALGIVDDRNTSPNDSMGESSSGDNPTPDSTSGTSFAPSSAHSAIMSAKVSVNDNLNIPATAILEAFGESKALTDRFIEDHRCSGYIETVMPKQAQLCVKLTAEAFGQLGCDLESAKAGQRLERIPHLAEHGRLVEYLYQMLEETRIVDLDGPSITRTAVSLPPNPSNIILQDLVHKYPDHVFASQLSYWTGSRLADILTGKADGLKLIFANDKGRELVSGLYGDSLLNKLAYSQMADFLRRLISKLPSNQGPLKILEMGAGTGGTTKWLLPLLASLGTPVEYTFTDLSSSFVAGARKRFKEYPFMRFQVHDIEKPPADQEMYHSQHIIVASNAVHATHSLTESTKNIHQFLRWDGFLMMLEMTETLHWVDMIFGVLEGWWLFNDGRRHAIAHESRWERELQGVGYGHVDWTGGAAPETKIQRVFIALASGPRFDRLPEASPPAKNHISNHETRRVAVDDYVRNSVQGFSILPSAGNTTSPLPICILVTGATGSLGSHLVAHFANLEEIDTVVCLNRCHNTEPRVRQQRAFDTRGITLDASSLSKLRVLETDISKPLLGLPLEEYDGLCATVTHIVHNAWPMSGKLPLKGFALQFQAMRHLVDFARDISCRRPREFPVRFQLVSSIATVGHYPLWTGKAHVPEERMTIESVLPNGYGDAKFVCERILDETLHRYPHLFRAMTVRLGQVAGSKTSGYWNHMEHFSFMVKSAQTLKALPDFDGLLSWTPVNDVAATMGDLLLANGEPFPVYHIDNPVRQQWRDMLPMLADALDVPRERIVPFEEWIRRVKAFPGAVEWDNPAAKLVEFLQEDFVRMSCGGVLLETTKSREHSQTLRSVGAVGADVVRGYLRAWKSSGFLHG